MRTALAFAAALTLATTTSLELAGQKRGDTTVVFPRAPKHPGVATLVPELTIGSVDGADEYLFNRICVVFPARDGTVWVADECGPVAQGTVRQYDSAGKHLRTIGGNGDGPGEYRSVNGIAQLPDGRILVRNDRGGNRINVFRADGRLDTTWTIHRYHTGEGLLVDPSGITWMPFTKGNPFAGEATSLMALRLRKDGTIIDSVPYPVLPQPRQTGVQVRVGRMELTAGGPFQPRAWSVLSPLGYFATYNTSRYRVDLRTSHKNPSATPVSLWRDGDPVLSIARTVNPVSVSEPERRERLAILEAQMEAERNPKSGSLGGIVRRKPPIRWANFGDDGRLWVGVSMPSEQYEPPPRPPARPGSAQVPPLRWREPEVYDVFEPDGRLIGRVRIPYGIARRSSRGDVVWATERTADGVELVRRYRIAWK